MKNLLKLSFLFAIFITLSVAQTTASHHHHDDDDDDVSIDTYDDKKTTFHLRGRLSPFLRRKMMTCNKHATICRSKGSPGPKCCKKKCVNVKKDRSNCGKCGRKCKFSETCCGGKCVKTFKNKKHCGGCGNRCKKGHKCVYGACSSCAFGLCGYA